jgi:hypothetical protein
MGRDTLSRESRYAVRAYFSPLVWLARGVTALFRLLFRGRARPESAPGTQDRLPVPPPRLPTPKPRPDTHDVSPT